MPWAMYRTAGSVWPVLATHAIGSPPSDSVTAAVAGATAGGREGSASSTRMT